MKPGPFARLREGIKTFFRAIRDALAYPSFC